MFDVTVQSEYDDSIFQGYFKNNSQNSTRMLKEVEETPQFDFSVNMTGYDETSMVIKFDFEDPSNLVFDN